MDDGAPTDGMREDLHFTAGPSAGRRILGVGILAVLGLLLLGLAALHMPGPTAPLMVLVLSGSGALGLGLRMHRATRACLELTQAGLFSSTGQMIAPFEAIVSVDRGAFAFKPSNGFVLRLSHGASAAWQPGLWWRLGRRVGVGGVVSAGQCREMAERIQAVLAARDARR